MRVLYLCGRERSYPRVNIIRKGLVYNGVEIVDGTIESRSLVRRSVALLWNFFCTSKKKYDLIYIGFFGQPFVPLIRKFTKRKVLFDAHLSAYNTAVDDKQMFVPGSIGAKIMYYCDLSSCRSAHAILLDTEQHIQYFVEHYNIPRNKFHRIWVGADDEIFNPIDVTESTLRTKQPEDFIVLFHGAFIPLQGVEYIVMCAKELENNPSIKFFIIGSGQTFKKCVSLARSLSLQNITFAGQLKQIDIPKEIARADIGLGIFGSTDKTQLVIPNKVFELAAMRKPIITANTPAIREFFVHGEDIYLCKHADPKSLAEAILFLRENLTLRMSMAEKAYRKFKLQCTPELIGRDVSKIAETLLRHGCEPG